jgi:GNAT superfamily N-acetyltransferase
MSPTPRAPLEVDCHPLSADRWQDLETLFGPRGACGGCWCMYWRLPRAQFTAQKGEGTKQALQHVVARGEIVGLLAYVKGQPVGWCAIAPRESYPVLARSRILKRVDEAPVWSVVCFFVSKGFRGQGLTTALLRAAVDYARQQGARVIEGYPIEPKNPRVPAVFAWTGLASAFRQAGFMEVLRRSETRPIMRYVVTQA